MHRYNTPLWNKHWGLVGGKITYGETAIQAAQRKALQEVNIQLSLQAFSFIHLIHTKHDDAEYMLLFFKANIEGCVPHNQLIDQYDALGFFDPEALPETVIPTHRQAINCLRQNIPYSEYGWDLG